MTERTQVQKSKTERKTEESAVETTKSKVDAEKIKADLDDLLDEIDDVLTENAAEFVNSYVQKGGQSIWIRIQNMLFPSLPAFA